MWPQRLSQVGTLCVIPGTSSLLGRIQTLQAPKAARSCTRSRLGRESPFRAENRLLMIGSDVSTRYTRRNEEEYEKILDYINTNTDAFLFSSIGQLAQDMDGLRLNCVQCLIVSLLSAVFMGATETVIAGDILACWTSLLFAGILSMGVAYTMQIVAQKVLEPTTASLIMSLESVFAAIGGWAILHEQMTRWELLGASLVFGAVLLSQVPEGLFKVKTSG